MTSPKSDAKREMPNKKILIVGASGLVGTAAVKLFSGLDDWDVVRHLPTATESCARKTHYISGRPAERRAVPRCVRRDGLMSPTSPTAR